MNAPPSTAINRKFKLALGFMLVSVILILLALTSVLRIPQEYDLLINSIYVIGIALFTISCFLFILNSLEKE